MPEAQNEQFFLDEAPVVEWPVRVRIATAAGFAERGFTGRFRLYSEAEYEDMSPKPELDADGKPLERSLKTILAENASILPRLLIGWDVKTPAGEPVPIEALPAHLTGPNGRALSSGIWSAVTELRYGIDFSGGASSGNSGKPPAAGSK
ncbi:MAG: hypothetical protein HGA47_06875 [Zoogloea sp.]|nr:hypothetical protein [Zoogloea sp.]